MYCMNDMDQTEFDFSENQETEQERLEREVLAAGGRVGRSEGRFNFGLDESEGYKRGDEHREIEGLYFWARNKSAKISRWMDLGAYNELKFSNTQKQRAYREDNRDEVLLAQRRYYRENREKMIGIQKKYYEENREKVIERNKRYREENKERVAESKRRHYEENREVILEKAKRYAYENREKIACRNRAYYENNKEKEAERQKRWREENPEKYAEGQKRWREENPEKVTAKTARRRARLREALDLDANKAIIESRYTAREYLSDVTGYEWHVDHTIPLGNGGKHHEGNLQVVPGKWNESKGARNCDRWIEDSDIYRYATAVEKRFEEEAKKSEKK